MFRLLLDTFTKYLPEMPSALIMEGCVRADLEKLLKVSVSYIFGGRRGIYLTMVTVSASRDRSV